MIKNKRDKKKIKQNLTLFGLLMLFLLPLGNTESILEEEQPLSAELTENEILQSKFQSDESARRVMKGLENYNRPTNLMNTPSNHYIYEYDSVLMEPDADWDFEWESTLTIPSDPPIEEQPTIELFGFEFDRINGINGRVVVNMSEDYVNTWLYEKISQHRVPHNVDLSNYKFSTSFSIDDITLYSNLVLTYEWFQGSTKVANATFDQPNDKMVAGYLTETSPNVNTWENVEFSTLFTDNNMRRIDLAFAYGQMAIQFFDFDGTQPIHEFPIYYNELVTQTPTIRMRYTEEAYLGYSETTWTNIEQYDTIELWEPQSTIGNPNHAIEGIGFNVTNMNNEFKNSISFNEDITTSSNSIESENMDNLDGLTGAVYEFENDEIGQVPENWTNYDGEAELIESYQGHSRVLRIRCTYHADRGRTYTSLDEPKENGIIEFYWNIASADIDAYRLLQLSNDGVGVMGGTRLLNFVVRNGVVQGTSVPWLSDTWYHVKLQWFSNYTYRIYVDGELVIGNTFEEELYPDSFMFAQWVNSHPYQYVSRFDGNVFDDPNYYEGRNTEIKNYGINNSIFPLAHEKEYVNEELSMVQDMSSGLNISVDESFEDRNYVLNSETLANSQEFSIPFNERSHDTFLEFSMSSNSTNQKSGILLGNSTHERFSLYFEDDGYIYYADQTSSTQLQAYSADTWYDIRLIISQCTNPSIAVQINQVFKPTLYLEQEIFPFSYCKFFQDNIHHTLKIGRFWDSKWLQDYNPSSFYWNPIISDFVLDLEESQHNSLKNGNYAFGFSYSNASNEAIIRTNIFLDSMHFLSFTQEYGSKISVEFNDTSSFDEILSFSSFTENFAFNLTILNNSHIFIEGLSDNNEYHNITIDSLRNLFEYDSITFFHANLEGNALLDEGFYTFISDYSIEYLFDNIEQKGIFSRTIGSTKYFLEYEIKYGLDLTRIESVNTLNELANVSLIITTNEGTRTIELDEYDSLTGLQSVKWEYISFNLQWYIVRESSLWESHFEIGFIADNGGFSEFTPGITISSQSMSEIWLYGSDTYSSIYGFNYTQIYRTRFTETSYLTNKSFSNNILMDLSTITPLQPNFTEIADYSEYTDEEMRDRQHNWTASPFLHEYFGYDSSQINTTYAHPKNLGIIEAHKEICHEVDILDERNYIPLSGTNYTAYELVEPMFGTGTKYHENMGIHSHRDSTDEIQHFEAAKAGTTYYDIVDTSYLSDLYSSSLYTEGGNFYLSMYLNMAFNDSSDFNFGYVLREFRLEDGTLLARMHLSESGILNITHLQGGGKYGNFEYNSTIIDFPLEITNRLAFGVYLEKYPNTDFTLTIVYWGHSTTPEIVREMNLDLREKGFQSINQSIYWDSGKIHIRNAYMVSITNNAELYNPLETYSMVQLTESPYYFEIITHDYPSQGYNSFDSVLINIENLYGTLIDSNDYGKNLVTIKQAREIGGNTFAALMNISVKVNETLYSEEELSYFEGLGSLKPYELELFIEIEFYVSVNGIVTNIGTHPLGFTSSYGYKYTHNYIQVSNAFIQSDSGQLDMRSMVIGSDTINGNGKILLSNTEIVQASGSSLTLVEYEEAETFYVSTLVSNSESPLFKRWTQQTSNNTYSDYLESLFLDFASIPSFNYTVDTSGLDYPEYTAETININRNYFHGYLNMENKPRYEEGSYVSDKENTGFYHPQNLSIIEPYSYEPISAGILKNKDYYHLTNQDIQALGTFDSVLLNLSRISLDIEGNPYQYVFVSLSQGRVYDSIVYNTTFEIMLDIDNTLYDYNTIDSITDSFTNEYTWDYLNLYLHSTSYIDGNEWQTSKTILGFNHSGSIVYLYEVLQLSNSWVQNTDNRLDWEILVVNGFNVTQSGKILVNNTKILDSTASDTSYLEYTNYLTKYLVNVSSTHNLNPILRWFTLVTNETLDNFSESLFIDFETLSTFSEKESYVESTSNNNEANMRDIREYYEGSPFISECPYHSYTQPYPTSSNLFVDKENYWNSLINDNPIYEIGNNHDNSISIGGYDTLNLALAELNESYILDEHNHIPLTGHDYSVYELVEPMFGTGTKYHENMGIHSHRDSTDEIQHFEAAKAGTTYYDIVDTSHLNEKYSSSRFTESGDFYLSMYLNMGFNDSSDFNFGYILREFRLEDGTLLARMHLSESGILNITHLQGGGKYGNFEYNSTIIDFPLEITDRLAFGVYLEKYPDTDFTLTIVYWGHSTTPEIVRQMNLDLREKGFQSINQSIYWDSGKIHIKHAYMNSIVNNSELVVQEPNIHVNVNQIRNITNYETLVDSYEGYSFTVESRLKTWLHPNDSRPNNEKYEFYLNTYSVNDSETLLLDSSQIGIDEFNDFVLSDSLGLSTQWYLEDSGGTFTLIKEVLVEFWNSSSNTPYVIFSESREIMEIESKWDIKLYCEEFTFIEINLSLKTSPIHNMSSTFTWKDMQVDISTYLRSDIPSKVRDFETHVDNHLLLDNPTIDSIQSNFEAKSDFEYVDYGYPKPHEMLYGGNGLFMYLSLDVGTISDYTHPQTITISSDTSNLKHSVMDSALLNMNELNYTNYDYNTLALLSMSRKITPSWTTGLPDVTKQVEFRIIRYSNDIDLSNSSEVAYYEGLGTIEDLVEYYLEIRVFVENHGNRDLTDYDRIRIRNTAETQYDYMGFNTQWFTRYQDGVYSWNLNVSVEGSDSVYTTSKLLYNRQYDSYDYETHENMVISLEELDYTIYTPIRIPIVRYRSIYSIVDIGQPLVNTLFFSLSDIPREEEYQIPFDDYEERELPYWEFNGYVLNQSGSSLDMRFLVWEFNWTLYEVNNQTQRFHYIDRLFDLDSVWEIEHDSLFQTLGLAILWIVLGLINILFLAAQFIIFVLVVLFNFLIVQGVLWIVVLFLNVIIPAIITIVSSLLNIIWDTLVEFWNDFMVPFLEWLWDFLQMVFLWLLEQLLIILQWIYDYILLPVWEWLVDVYWYLFPQGIAHWFMNTALPWIGNLIVIIISFILTCIVVLFTLGYADPIETYQMFYGFFSDILVYILDFIEFLVFFLMESIPVLLIYVCLIGLAIPKIYYARSKGWEKRAHQLEESIKVYFMPIKVLIDLLGRLIHAITGTMIDD